MSIGTMLKSFGNLDCLTIEFFYNDRTMKLHMKILSFQETMPQILLSMIQKYKRLSLHKILSLYLCSIFFLRDTRADGGI